MKVFLTGAIGFIGQVLVRAKHQRDWQVSALVRDTNGAAAQWLRQQSVTLVVGDVTQPKGLTEALRGFDVLLLATTSHPTSAARPMRTRWRWHTASVGCRSTSSCPMAWPVSMTIPCGATFCACTCCTPWCPWHSPKTW